ncbi:MAG: PilN domain-containing protein [Candidatus Paceibacterota bacterium]
MLYLLPNSQKVILNKEYTLRFIVVVFMFMFATFLIATFLLIPSYRLLTTTEDVILESKNMILRSSSEKSNKNISLAISETKGLLTLLTSESENIKSTEVFEKILSSRPTGIRINTISFEEQKGGSSLVLINGISDNRSDLINFSQTLRKESGFSSVDLPISNLAKDKDIVFSITIKVNKK